MPPRKLLVAALLAVAWNAALPPAAGSPLDDPILGPIAIGEDVEARDRDGDGFAGEYVLHVRLGEWRDHEFVPHEPLPPLRVPGPDPDDGDPCAPRPCG